MAKKSKRGGVNGAFIYGLVDPRDNRIRYIGKANNPTFRFRMHLTPRCLRDRTHKNNWINSLIAQGLKPRLLLLQRVEAAIWEDAERFWILFFLWVGGKLTNETMGGDGMHDPSPEIRAKMGSPGRPPWNKGKPMTPEQRRKAHESGLWASRPGYWRGKSLPSATIEKFRAARIGQPSWNKGKPMSAGARDKISSDWLVENPSGERFEIRNLAAFCREHDLLVPLMNKVAHGERRHHRGWTCQKIDGPQSQTESL